MYRTVELSGAPGFTCTRLYTMTIGPVTGSRSGV
jgi:hypothetical protein